MNKNIDGKKPKNLRRKYGQKLLNHAKQYATDILLYWFKKGDTAAKTTGDLIGDKIADKITKTSSQNNSETVTNKTKSIDYQQQRNNKIMHREITKLIEKLIEKSQQENIFIFRKRAKNY